MTDHTASLVAHVMTALARHNWSIATAESLTGGLVCAALTSVPGASAHVRGGVVAYGRHEKVHMLTVEDALIERVGTVDPDVAIAMARGAADRLGSDVAVSTTGVAGPDPHSGHQPGDVHIAVVSPRGATHRHIVLSGDRGQIREGAVDAALALVLEHLTEG